MKYKLYKLALWYIGKCNKEDTSYKGYKKEIKELDKLTFRCWGKANLLYGLGAEWENFGRYDVLDNAIQRLAEYEELGTVEELKEAREKQVAKSPTLEGDGYCPEGNLVYDTWICPNCDKDYEVDYDDYDYCPNCGQKIDRAIFY